MFEQDKFAIVLGRFNDLIGGRLLEGVLGCIKCHFRRNRVLWITS